MQLRHGLEGSSPLCGRWGGGPQDQLSHLAEVLSGGGEEELVSCAICTSQAQAVHPRMGLRCANSVLNLFPLAAGCDIGVGFRKIPWQVTCAFVERSGDFAVGLTRTALRPEGAGVAVMFTGVTSHRQSTH